jgi:hypothetical protein
MQILYCKLNLHSTLSLERLAAIISARIFGGIPFVSGRHSIRDEVPAVCTETEFLGMQAVLMGEPDEEGYYLTMDTRSPLLKMSADEIRSSQVDISSLVASLLQGVDGVFVRT